MQVIWKPNPHYRDFEDAPVEESEILEYEITLYFKIGDQYQPVTGTLKLSESLYDPSEKSRSITFTEESISRIVTDEMKAKSIPARVVLDVIYKNDGE